MGKNQGFHSVNLSKARDNSTWAVSWLAELTVTPSSPLCVRPENLRVWIQNVPVCTGTTPACVTTCGRGAGAHGDVLNLHTEDLSACQAAPHTIPHHTTHNTTQHTTHHNTTHTPHNTETETERQRKKTETARERERQRERQRETEKERQEKRR